jgi:hypothetical protein
MARLSIVTDAPNWRQTISQTSGSPIRIPFHLDGNPIPPVASTIAIRQPAWHPQASSFAAWSSWSGLRRAMIISSPGS